MKAILLSYLLCAFTLLATAKNIPTSQQVGTACLPDSIAPVTAPFSIPQFKHPEFPSFEINVTETGAKQNILSTKAIQAAIDEVNRHGGGKVVIPPGTWLTGRIILKSNVNLYISEGANVNFSGNVDDYLPVVFTRSEGVELMSLGALIYANGQDNIALTGKGTLIGPAKDCEILQLRMKGSVVENYVSPSLPIEKRVYDGKNGKPIFCPLFFGPINCKNVFVEGVHFEKSIFWNIVPEYCENIIIRGATVNSVGFPATDGIDIESSKNILIEYCTLSCGDDCFTIKAGRGDDGLRVNKPSENIVIRYCLAKEGHGGITVGRETAGMIRNLYAHDCVFEKTQIGLRFKTRRPRGGGGENLTYERIRMNINDYAFRFDMLGSRQYVGEMADRYPARPVTRLTPVFRNISARNILVENARMFLNIQGIPESPVSNLLIENSDVHCKDLISVSDAKDVTIRNVHISVTNPTIKVLDGRNIAFDKMNVNSPENILHANISGDLVRNIRFINCSPQKPDGWKGSTWKNAPYQLAPLKGKSDRATTKMKQIQSGIQK
jgi:hypothetical protein